MPSKVKKLRMVVQQEPVLQRLDKYCTTHCDSISRTIFSDKETLISVNGKSEKKSHLVKTGDVIELQYTVSFFEGVEPQDIPLDILYEDKDMLVINKKQGMVVHPANGNWDNTLVNALLFRYGTDFSTGGEDDEQDDEPSDVRPGIVHRLDKDTSGTMVIARTRESHRNLALQFKEHTNRKIYIALAKGTFAKKEGTITTGIRRSSSDRKKFCVCPQDEGRIACTDYQVLRQYPSCALVRVTLHTGRTHQIRVHLASLGHPIIGDSLYGQVKGEETLMLHSFSLSIDSPSSGERMTFRSPLPQRFKAWLIPHYAKKTAPSQ